MPGIEDRVTDLETDMTSIEKRMDTAEARLDYAGKLIHVLADFAKEAGVRIAAVEAKSHDHDEPGKAL